MKTSVPNCAKLCQTVPSDKNGSRKSISRSIPTRIGAGGGWRSKEDPFGLKIEHQHVVIRPFLMKLHVAKVCAKGAQTRRPGHFPLEGTR